MSDSPDKKPAPRGGLPWQREKAVIVAAAGPLALLCSIPTILFPTLPLAHPFFGAILAQIPWSFRFTSCTGRSAGGGWRGLSLLSI